METKFDVYVNGSIGGGSYISISVGPYTRKRDAIRGLKRSLPKNFKFKSGAIDGWGPGVNNLHYREHIVDISNGQMGTETYYNYKNSRKIHIYKF